MEWVETTAKTLEEAKELALDRLGVAADEAEFEILEEPRAGLFGRMRGEARVRARVMPTAVRPKQDRRGRGRQRDAAGKGSSKGAGKGKAKSGDGRARGGRAASDDAADESAESVESADDGVTTEPAADRADGEQGSGDQQAPKKAARSRRQQQSKQQKEQQVNTDEAGESPVTPAEVGAAAETFMSGLASAFGMSATTEVAIDGSDIEVTVNGSGLGLMVGHGGRTLTAVQDLARVASQRRLGDHETRLRVDVGGYRAKRGEALARFAVAVANEVVESGTAKALEPMQSADRKVVHDALAGVEGVTSRSEGDDPMRRVIISPA